MRHRVLLLAIVVVAVFAATAAAKHFWFITPEEPRATENPVPAVARRIVSRAPSLTDTLFALGLGDRVVGVTPFCIYPEAAKALPKTGGLDNPDYERIIALKPDLVILTTGLVAGTEYNKLSEIGIRTLALRQRTVGDIFDAIEQIGQTCGATAPAKALVQDLRTRMQRVHEQTRDLPRPRVLVVISREYGVAQVRDAVIAGRGNFYDDLLAAAGAQNAYTGDQEYPQVAAEGLITLNPEVIVEIAAPGMNQPADVARQWQNLSTISAVKTGRIHLFDDGYEVLPSPRFVQTLERLARVAHPELEPKGTAP
jgi:iron complex transport system substrate-binding protein